MSYRSLYIFKVRVSHLRFGYERTVHTLASLKELRGSDCANMIWDGRWVRVERSRGLRNGRSIPMIRVVSNDDPCVARDMPGHSQRELIGLASSARENDACLG